MIKVVCVRGDKSITFAHTRPYWLTQLDGIGEASYDVTSEKAAGQDGEVYMGSTANKRAITIKATVILPDGKTHDQIREEFFAFFVPRETGTLYIYEGETSRKIDYKTESCEFDMDGIDRDVEISLICPDPVFRSITDTQTEISNVVGLIEWPIELPPEFEVAIRYEGKMANISNPTSVDWGLTVTFTADGEVVNPKLTEVNSQKSFRLLTSMHAGDVIVVTTGAGNKRIKLIRDGQESNINHLWEFGGTWLQVEPGENSYTYTADSGEDAVAVTLSATPLYWGA